MSPTKPEAPKLPEIPTEAGPVPAPTLPVEPVAPPPTLEEDLAGLRKLDCLRACVKRWRNGKHPDEHIESMLSRRLEFSEDPFLTPFLLRVFTALAMVFSTCVVAWAGFWFLLWQFGYLDYLRELSIWMTFLLIGMGMVVLANPGRSYDEIALAKAIQERLQQLEKELEGGDPAKAGKESGKTESGVP